MTEPSTPQYQPAGLNRREVLKALMASGGALAVAAFLPSKWGKPMVEAGVLPAHAQGSICIELTFIESGYCASRPDLVCGNFDLWSYWQYVPGQFTPQEVIVEACGNIIPSSMLYTSGNTFYVFVNSADFNCPGYRKIYCITKEGCIGIWVSYPILSKKPAAPSP
jgi:hypothetical protein